MLDLIRNPEDRFSHDAAHIFLQLEESRRTALRRLSEKLLEQLDIGLKHEDSDSYSVHTGMAGIVIIPYLLYFAHSALSFSKSLLKCSIKLHPI